MNYYFLTHITHQIHHTVHLQASVLVAIDQHIHADTATNNSIGNGDIPATCIAPRRPTITTAPPFPFDAVKDRDDRLEIYLSALVPK